MLYQNDPRLLPEIQKEGCLFMCLLYSREAIQGITWEPEEVNELWVRMKERGVINSDTLLITSYTSFLETVALPIRWISQDNLGLKLGSMGWPLPVEEPMDPKRFWVVERWRWRLDHFVKGDGTGSKPVTYDPIQGGSYTIRYGKIVDLRVFEVKGA